MKATCENCHTEPVYKPKIDKPGDFPKLCYNCHIRASGILYYVYQMTQKTDMETIDALEELYNGVETLHPNSAARQSIYHMLETLGDYWTRTSDKGPTLRRIK